MKTRVVRRFNSQTGIFVFYVQTWQVCRTYMHPGKEPRDEYDWRDHYPWPYATQEVAARIAKHLSTGSEFQYEDVVAEFG